MKAPSNSSHIRREWVQFVVEEYLKKTHPQPKPEVEVKEFFVGRGANPDDGFNSELVTLDVKATLTEAETAETLTSVADYHFVVKFLSTNVMNKTFNRKHRTSLREFIIYAEYVKEINEFQSSFTSDECRVFIPDLIYAKYSEKEFVIVMENIKYNGYENQDKYLGLDFPHLKAAVIQLARFHALSYAHDKKQQFLQKYPCFLTKEGFFRLTSAFFSTFQVTGLTVLHKMGNKEGLIRRIEASREKLMTQYMEAYKSPPGIPVCVIHGDYWNNNLMFKFHEKGENEDSGETVEDQTQIHCKLLDWGAARWGSPVIDLQYLIHSSTTLETRRDHLEDVLQCYHSTFTQVTARVGEPCPSWSYDDFMKEWQRLSAYGFIVGAALVQFTLSKSNPYIQNTSSSLLDHPACLPTKYVVEGMMTAMAKTFISCVARSSNMKFVDDINRKTYIPISDEISSGSNEIMNQRLLDLITEADEKGLFQE